METLSTFPPNNFCASSSFTVGKIITLSPGYNQKPQKIKPQSHPTTKPTTQLAGVATCGILSTSCNESMTLKISLNRKTQLKYDHLSLLNLLHIASSRLRIVHRQSQNVLRIDDIKSPNCQRLRFVVSILVVDHIERHR